MTIQKLREDAKEAIRLTALDDKSVRAYRTHFENCSPEVILALCDAVKALRQLYDDQMDYIKINNLCGAENNQVMALSREALAKLEQL